MLQKIALQDFRNFEAAEFDLSAASTVFTGRNGSGKSSLLEAIYFFSSLRSFRTPNVRELKRIGSSGFFLKLLDRSGGEWDSELKIDWARERRLYIDGLPVNRASEFAGRFRMVTFLPDDERLITEGPARRRKFIDRYLCLTDPEFMRLLQEYSEAVRNYNFLLKSKISDPASLMPFGRIMAEKVQPVREKREDALVLFSERAGRILEKIRPEMTNLVMRSIPEGDFRTPDEFANQLRSDISRDLPKGYCSIGPHRDDIRITAGNMLLRDYGSRGQCRIAALSIRLAEYELLSEHFPGNVKVLADDALSDLDKGTRQQFLERIASAEQIFYAFPELPPEKQFSASNVISLY